MNIEKNNPLVSSNEITKFDKKKQPKINKDEPIFKINKGKVISMNGGSPFIPEDKSFVCSLAKCDVNCVKCKCYIGSGMFLKGKQYNVCIGCHIEPIVSHHYITVNYLFNKNQINYCRICKRIISKNERYVFNYDDIDSNYICSCCGNSPLLDGKLLNYYDPEIHYIMFCEFLQDRLITHYNILDILHMYINNYGTDLCLQGNNLLDIIGNIFMSANMNRMNGISAYDMIIQNKLQKIRDILLSNSTPILNFINRYVENI